MAQQSDDYTDAVDAMKEIAHALHTLAMSTAASPVRGDLAMLAGSSAVLALRFSRYAPEPTLPVFSLQAVELHTGVVTQMHDMPIVRGTIEDGRKVRL